MRRNLIELRASFSEEHFKERAVRSMPHIHRTNLNGMAIWRNARQCGET